MTATEITRRKHHAVIYCGAGLAWAVCTCQWKSTLYTTNSGASRAFAEHLREVAA